MSETWGEKYMDTIMEIVKNLDWTPLFISFKTGIVATVISFFLGLFAARKVIHAGERVKAIADGFLTLPMVLPPTVAGCFLLLLFSKRRPIGMFLFDQFGIVASKSYIAISARCHGIKSTLFAFVVFKHGQKPFPRQHETKSQRQHKTQHYRAYDDNIFFGVFPHNNFYALK